MNNYNFNEWFDSINNGTVPSDYNENNNIDNTDNNIIKNYNLVNSGQIENKSNNLKNNNDNKLKYIVSIIGDGKTRSICLNDLNKDTITFGRSSNNDIVISSNLVSSKHGYFKIVNGQLIVYDQNSKNGLYINNVKCNNNYFLKDGDTIKIDNINRPLNIGVILIISIGNSENQWMEYSLLGKDSISIGRAQDCDIVLEQVSISAKHARITSDGNGYYISSFDAKSGVILNNSILKGQMLLKDKDVILINNSMLIYNDCKIVYQKYNASVRLDAIDIVKTVRIKGKKRDISQHVNFTANPGEFIAFVGGSGAGKSTFMKCISGVNKPTSGQVFINGHDLFSNYIVLKNLIGYVPQDNIIFMDLTLNDVLKYAANLRMPDDATKAEKKARINEVLDIVELSNKKDVMIRNLSGGQQKRACIAVELLADPKLFFLDEPTSGLDPGTERSIMKTLRKMANSGKTIILVTHNTLNLHLCDKVVFFGFGGKLCFDGKPKDALEFFGVNDFVDIYNHLNNNADEWNEKFNKSKYKHIEKVEENKEEETNNYTKPKSYFKQLFTLIRRKFKTLFNNKQQLLLLFGQAPLIAFLMSAVVSDDIFYTYEDTKSILFGLTTAAIWIGLMNSILEVCKERVILDKEYMADLRLSAYLSSKIIYLFILSLMQASLLVLTFMLLVDVPQIGVSISWHLEMTMVEFMTIFVASSLGLVVSVFAKDSSSALTIPVILLIPQLIFAGILFPLEGIVEKVSNFMISRWSVEALGTINDLNSLVSVIQEAIPGYVREIENYYTFTLEHLTYDLVIIGVMTIIFFGTSYYLLKRQLEGGK